MKTAVTPIAAFTIGLFATTFMVAVPSQPAVAQMFEKPWSATPQNRAQMAVIMKQAESGMFNGSDGTTASVGNSSSLTQLVCGGGGGEGGSSSAAANSACIIMNNSTGNVGAGQDSVGDQNANVAESSTTNNTSLSETLETVSGDNN